MAKLASMSIDALLKLRDDVGRVLAKRAEQLNTQLSQLGIKDGRGRRSPMKGRKVPVKFRDKEGNTWAGRGAQPRWLRDKLKSGAKLQDFAVEKSVASRKPSARKTKKRRKARR
jgi:DNA-binding protein H-NS